jgi:hypothetical protein
MSRSVIALRQRPWDAALVAFFVINLFFTTYVVSLEQVVIDDIYRFTPPLWPPSSLLALVHWWEKSFDPLLIARPGTAPPSGSTSSRSGPSTRPPSSPT